MAFFIDRKFNLYIVWSLIVLFLVVAGMASQGNGAQPATIWAGDPAEHAVALTFDDGPSPLYTPQVLALLKQYQAHATFFVLGRKVEESPGLVKAMLKEGHEVGNHSFSHPRLTKTDQASREKEIETTSLDLDLLAAPGSTG